MPTLVVVGAQWGDEGKGKIVDLLTDRSDLVVRYAGGHNAGHTVIVGGEKFVLHLIPSGILHPRKRCFLGGGMVLDPEAFLTELGGLEKRGIRAASRLRIAPEAHLIMPYHKTIDLESEKLRGKRKIGTTGRGIGPAYVDKVARVGIRVADLLDPEVLRDKLAHNVGEKNTVYRHVYRIPALKAPGIYRRYLEYGRRLAPFVADVSRIAADEARAGKAVLFEGAQGTMLDVDHGTYPFVTSSSAVSGGACIGVGVGPTAIGAVLGVVKAYTTRVGEGPFPTELGCELGTRLRDGGSEYGATTGRPRRCGWFDAVVARYSRRVNGITGLALTKLDVLDSFPEIKVCTAYRHRGRTLREMPYSLQAWREAVPVYRTVKGWMRPTNGARRFSELPPRARDYVRLLEDLAESRFRIISTGPGREETIQVSDPFQR